MKKRLVIALTLTLAALIMAGGALADDGKKVMKRMSHEGNPPVYEGYELLNEHAFIHMMRFYVPAQAANGTVVPVDYYNVDETLVDSRDLAKPLIGVYLNGPVEEVEGVGFVGHGKREAFGAISLDDGVTWKNTNLSESADLTSQTRDDDVYRPDIPLFHTEDDDSGAYPGDVVNIFHAVADNKVLVAWPSRFCSQGQPNYSLDADDEDTMARRAAIAAHLGIDLATASADDLYLVDMYRVAGQQGSIDYAEDKWEQNHVVGEVPFNCVWTARGELVDGDDPRTDATESSYMRWFKAERLTSGRRDANRIEVKAVPGAGFAMTWQEDPDGLRPGQGEGPGEGWSGAIGNSGTDIWYSYIDWEDFDLVQDPNDETGATLMTFANYTALTATDADVTQKPKPFVPMSMPMPITDNAKCNPENPAPYCWGSALQDGEAAVPAPTDSLGTVLDPLAYGLKDMCADLVDIPTGPNAELKPICITEDGIPLVGNSASTRARLNLFGYASAWATTNTIQGGIDSSFIDNAFAIVQVEEDKGLGRASYLKDPETGLPTETICPDDADEKDCVAWDIGKNQRYHSFSMSLTDDLADDDQDGLIANLTFPGHLLNQPEVDWTTGAFIPPLNTSEIWDFGDYNFEIYNTEIARRGSLLAQDIYKVHKDTSDAKSGLVVLPTWKQGQMNQGGPADVMARRIVMKDNWKLSRDGNPYAFRNLDCKTWAKEAADNPYYPGGVCLDPAVNLSGTIPDTAVDSQTGEAVMAPYVLADGTSSINPILQGIVQGEGDTTKILTWHQCPSNYTVLTDSGGTTIVECTATDSTLDDQSWYNPLDVAKGHRGFLDGDFVMLLYAWSPNWRLNTVGHDRYELYIRRSFDGGDSWTTLPSNYKHWDGSTWNGDGTVVCETYRTADQQQQGDSTEPHVCYEYGAGANEQARNVTQHQSMRTTTLDPRYAATPPSLNAELFQLSYGVPGYTSGGDSEDLRDPSRYFVVFETGDNTTTEFGEAEPLDLYYSRAVNFGDDYQVWAEDDLSVCYPSDPHDDDKVATELVGSGFCNEFDKMESGTPGLEASEASLTANPGGEFLYGVWSQELLDEDTGDLLESDAMARRVWWIDGYVSETYGWDFGQGPSADQ
jgi:hypothetical protein